MYNNELSHHGIKGQKWGQQNGPPYPLRSSDRSAAEKKAGRINLGASGSASSAKKQENKSVVKARKTEYKNIRTMSDKEIDEQTKRLEKEKRLKSLYRDDLYEKRDEFKDTYKRIRNEAIKSAATAAAVYIGQQYVKRLFNRQS